MPRNPRAATTLIAEIQSLVGDIVVEADDLDGLGVYRTFTITSKTRKGLADVVNAVADERIVSSRSVPNGVQVTFTHRFTADRGTQFGVRDAESLITRRKPAKKTAATG